MIFLATPSLLPGDERYARFQVFTESSHYNLPVAHITCYCDCDGRLFSLRRRLLRLDRKVGDSDPGCGTRRPMIQNGRGSCPRSLSGWVGGCFSDKILKEVKADNATTHTLVEWT